MAAMWMHAHFTTQSGTRDFLVPLILRGVGLGLIFVPLTNLALADLPMAKIPSGTGLFNLFRQLGGSVGIAVGATLVSRYGAIYRSDLATHITRFDEPARQRLAALAANLVARGTNPSLAESQAIAILNLQVARQATMITFEHLFMLFGLGFVLCLPILLFMRKGRGFQGGGAAH
jgi:DHA2 family multidrug resistance protein